MNIVTVVRIWEEHWDTQFKVSEGFAKEDCDVDGVPEVRRQSGEGAIISSP